MSRPGLLFLPSWATIALYAAAVVVLGMAFALVYGALRRVGRSPVAPPGGTSRLLRLALLQGRVVRTPAGLAHAAVFWGFLTLLAATVLVNLDWWVLSRLGVRLLTGPIYTAFMVAVEGAGLLMTVGAAVSGCLPRRTPRQRAVLGLFFLVGLSGFAVEAYHVRLYPESARFVGSWLASHSASPHAAIARGYPHLWATHAAVAFLLIALLPGSVLLHAVAAPLRLWWASERAPAECSTPFDLRQLVADGAFDVQVGARHVTDFEPALRLALLACTDCGRCDDVCPARRAGGTLSPRSVVTGLRDELRRNGPPRELCDDVVPAAAVWECTTCAACAEACPVLITPHVYLLELRRAAVADFRLPAPPAEVLARLERHGNPYGSLPGERERALARVSLPTLKDDPDPEWLYWLGCSTASDPRIQDVARAVVRLLRSAGVRVAALSDDESCCGDGARRLGEEGRFQQLGVANAERLSALGVRRVVTHCAHCCNTLRNEYPRFGWQGEVLHHTELLARLRAEGRLRLRPLDRAVAFHDACYQARCNTQVEAPRDLLAACGTHVLELDERGAATRCCGGGGGSFAQGTALSREMARRRAAQVPGQAETLAVECPFCLKMLSEATDGAVSVRDVAEVLADALDASEEEAACPSRRP